MFFELFAGDNYLDTFLSYKVAVVVADIECGGFAREGRFSIIP